MSLQNTICQQETDVCEALPNELLDNPFFSNRGLRVEQEGNRITLKGTVNSFFHKQMAQEVVRHLEGVDEIENQLIVDWK